MPVLNIAILKTCPCVPLLLSPFLLLQWLPNCGIWLSYSCCKETSGAFKGRPPLTLLEALCPLPVVVLPSYLLKWQRLVLLVVSSLVPPHLACGSHRLSPSRHSFPLQLTDLFLWKNLHRVKVTGCGAGPPRPRGSVSRCTSWEVALSNLLYLYQLLFPSGYWVFLQAQPLTLCFSLHPTLGRSPSLLTSSKTTLNPFL